MGFVYLGDFAAHAAFALASENLGKLFKSFDQTEWRFVENHGSDLVFQFFKTGLAAFFHGQEAFEAESVAWQARRHKCRDAGRRSGKRADGDTFSSTFACEQETRIGNSGSAGVADKGHVHSRQNLFLYHAHGLVLVVFVMRKQFSFNLIVLQQHR